MIDCVLVPMDESPMARRALEFALEVHPTATITVLYVADYVEESHTARMLVGPETLRERARERAEALFERARSEAADSGVELTTAVRFGDPARTIVDYAAEVDADLIVMGSHGRSLVSEVLLGDTARTVIRRAPVPVTLLR
jgi:nucleotide-binding universal stress UspA family protein